MYVIAPLITALLFLSAGLFIFLKNKRSEVNFAYFLLCFATFGWQFSWVILFAFDSKVNADILVRIGYSFIVFIPVAYFHFVIAFLKEKQKAWLFGVYFVGAIFELLVWRTPYLVDGYYSYFWGHYPKAGLLHTTYLLFAAVLSVKGLLMFLKHLKTEKSFSDLNQIKYVLLALIFYILASI